MNAVELFEVSDLSCVPVFFSYSITYLYQNGLEHNHFTLWIINQYYSI